MSIRHSMQYARSASEIVATRSIEEGEEVTISYFAALGGMSTTRRALLFQEQHLWPLPPSPHGPEADALLNDVEAGGAGTERAAAGEDVAQRAVQFEEQLEQLDDAYQVRSNVDVDMNSKLDAQ